MGKIHSNTNPKTPQKIDIQEQFDQDEDCNADLDDDESTPLSQKM